MRFNVRFFPPEAGPRRYFWAVRKGRLRQFFFLFLPGCSCTLAGLFASKGEPRFLVLAALGLCLMAAGAFGNPAHVEKDA
jgi:hypothetical protein